MKISSEKVNIFGLAGRNFCTTTVGLWPNEVIATVKIHVVVLTGLKKTTKLLWTDCACSRVSAAIYVVHMCTLVHTAVLS